jgi:quinohemoprotein ethanol dehydrogenase
MGGRTTRLVGTRLVFVLVGAIAAAVFAATALARTDVGAGTSSSASVGASWGTVGGDLADTRYSVLTQIDPSNVASLKVAWTAKIESTPGTGGENIPLVVGNSLLAQSNSETLASINASTGEIQWVNTAASRGDASSYTSRGEAVGDGLVYLLQGGPFQTAGNGAMEAFDLATGKPVWKTQINLDNHHTYGPPTPIFFNHVVYVGSTGSDAVGGARGDVSALDAKTGKILWQWFVTPNPGTPAAASWSNKTSETIRGGGASWTNGAIDPRLGLLYMPTGNPWPDFGRSAGDNLYTDGLVALSLKTGKVKWFYQTTHHDEWDYDCATPPVLWDAKMKSHGGKLVHGVTVTCKNGYVYELDRATGKPVLPVVEKPVANAKTDPAAATLMTKTYKWLRTNGKALTEPIPVGDAITPHCATPSLLPSVAPDGKPYEYSCAYNYYSADHYVAGTNQDSMDWEPLSYNQKLGYTYFCANDGIRSVKLGDPAATQVSDAQVWPQLLTNGNGGSEPRAGWFTALNVQNNKKVWQAQYTVSCKMGSATTASGLVFTGDASGNFIAFDAKTGQKLFTWTLPTLGLSSAPIVYSVNGKEYIAMTVGLAGSATVVALALP